MMPKDYHQAQADAFAAVVKHRRAVTAALLAQPSGNCLRRLSSRRDMSAVCAAIPRNLHPGSGEAAAYVGSVLSSRDPKAITALHIRTSAIRDTLRTTSEGPWKRKMVKLLIALDTALWSAVRTVEKIAKMKVKRRIPGLPEAWDDAVSAALCGAYTAAEKFQVGFGVKFGTFAEHWIVQAIDRHLEVSLRMIRYPSHLSSFLFGMRRYVDVFQAKHGRMPTDAEVAKGTGYSNEVVQKLRVLVAQPKSADEAISTASGEPDGITYGDTLSDKGPSPEEIVADAQTRERVVEMMKRLDPKERRALELRYGLADGKERTLEEAGVIMLLSRERIRQLETRAIAKLQLHSDGKRLTISTQALLNALVKRKRNRQQLGDRATRMRKMRDGGMTEKEIAHECKVSLDTVKAVLRDRSNDKEREVKRLLAAKKASAGKSVAA